MKDSTIALTRLIQLKSIKDALAEEYDEILDEIRSDYLFQIELLGRGLVVEDASVHNNKTTICAKTKLINNNMELARILEQYDEF